MAKRNRETDSESSTTREQAEEFERIAKQLDSLHSEFVIQSKSKPDNAINKFKLKMLNEKIAAANRILAGAYKPFDGFTEFDEVELPTNSDVSLVLTTYLASLERWRSARVVYDDNKLRWSWRTQDGSSIAASAPTRYKPAEK